MRPFVNGRSIEGFSCFKDDSGKRSVGIHSFSFLEYSWRPAFTYGN